MEIDKKFENFLKKHYVPPEYVLIAKSMPHSCVHVMIAEDFNKIPIVLLHVIKMYYFRRGNFPILEFTPNKRNQFIEITIQKKVLTVPYEDIIDTKKFTKELISFYDILEEFVTFARGFSIFENLSYILTYALKSDEMNELLVLFMTGLTAGYGFGFNRAFLLVKRGRHSYNVELAVGPLNDKEAHHVWENLEYQEYNISEFVKGIDSLEITQSALQKYASHLKFDVTEKNSEFFENSEIRKFPLNEIPLALKEALMITSPIAVIPITSEFGDPGLFIMDNKFNRKRISKDTVNLLKLFGKQMDIVFRNLEMKERLFHKAHHDKLTGVMNRRSLDILPSQNGTLVMIDMDDFKKINDSFGHLEGDHILKRFANLLKTCIRANDLIVRYGGDEFILFLSMATLRQAKEVVERSLNLAKKNGMNFSAGVVKISAKRSLDDSIKLADKLLYKAKRKGKGIFISEEEEAS